MPCFLPLDVLRSVLRRAERVLSVRLGRSVRVMQASSGAWVVWAVAPDGSLVRVPRLRAPSVAALVRRAS